MRQEMKKLSKKSTKEKRKCLTKKDDSSDTSDQLLDLRLEHKNLVAKHKRLKKTYGIALWQWDNTLIKQNGVCAICKTWPKSGILCVDHEHVKGYKKLPPEEKQKYVRGLLCFCCNTSFGRIERRPNPRKLLEGIVEYFSQYRLKGDT